MARTGTQTATSEAPRMTLANIRAGRRPAPDRILLMGVEGVGKSSWAAAAPDPVFIAAEDGIRYLDVASFPEPKSYRDVKEAIRSLTKEDHPYRSIVIDTVDWLEPLVWQHVCRANGWSSIEDPGYGKGYIPVNDTWRDLCADLDVLRTTRSMEVILLAHTQIKPFDNPAGPNYNRFECKLHKGGGAILKEWTDVNLFATYEDQILDAKGKEQTDPTKRGKATTSGRRVAYTQRTPAWDAKNRSGLPFCLPLDYESYAAARAAGQPDSAEALEAEARELYGRIGYAEADGALVLSAIGKASGNAAAMAKVVDRLRTRAAEVVA